VDVVHAFSVIAALYALIPAMLAHVPFVVHVQDAQPPRPLRRAALRLLGRRATRLICVSEAVADMLRGIGVQAEKLVVVHNGVEERFLEQKAPRSAGLDGRGPRIGLFAHIIPWKGHEVFLDAAALLVRRFPSARFYLVGGRLAGVSEAYVDSLRARSAAPPLAGRVELTGACSDVVPWMAAMDVIVHTSVAPEAFGLVICEAMALGKPVIATDCGAPRELITDGTTGYLAPPGDVAALARTLERVLEQPDPEVGLRAAAACRLRFSPEAFGARLARAYETVLKDPAPIATA
jgi:glycosyltransferase involved in cell wall biosynthesis